MKKLSFFLMAMLVSLTSFAAALGEGYEKVTDISTLAAGDKVVLYCDDAELGVTGYNGNKDATVAAEGWVEYLVEAAEGGVLLKDGENYISLTSKNSFKYAAEGSVCKVSDAGVLYCTFSGKDYHLYENASAETKYYRMYADKATTEGYHPFYVYEVVAAQEPIMETVYFVNAQNWSTVNAYAWTTESNASWPGVAATKEAEQIAGYDVYSYTAEAGTYANVIFNNGSGAQTADLVWTAGKYYVKDGWYTKEEAEAKLAKPVEYESVYFVDNQGWGKVNIYTWSPEVGGWPGVAMTKEAEQLAGYDVYSYTVEKGTAFGGMLFNNTTGIQTGDLKWTAGKYYVQDGWYTKEEAEAKLAAPVVVTWTMVGQEELFTPAWTPTAVENDMEKQEDGSYVLVLENKTLKAGKYEYKAVKDHAWTVSIPQEGNYALDITSGGEYTIEFTVNADATELTAKATKHVVYDMEMPIAITNLTSEVVTMGDATYLQLMGSNAESKAEVELLLNNYTGEDKEYEVSTEDYYLTLGGVDLTLVSGALTQSQDEELGVVYTGQVIANMQGLVIALNLNMYSLSDDEPTYDMEMPLEITNLTTEVLNVDDQSYLQLMGRDDMNDADVVLFLNNYTGEDKEYEVNAESSYMTFGGIELTVIDGVMTQTGETYTGVVHTYAAEEDMYVAFILTMYAAPATVLELTDAIVAINEDLGTLTFNVPTEEGGYYAELAGYTVPGVHEGPQICVFMTPEVVAYTNYAETSVADGIITLKGEFTSFMGAKFDVTISGKLPVEEPVEQPEPVYTENNLNTYAFGLESELTEDASVLNVTYRLNNSNATSVNVLVYNGEQVVATIAGGTSIGKNVVEVSTAELPQGIELTWGVEVNGTSVEVPTQEEKMYSMYCPHGLAIDKDPESEYFGRILVADAMSVVKDKTGYLGSGIGAGLHAFNPSFTTDSTVYTGGNDFTRILASNGYQPWRVKISEDGRIFVSSLDLNGVVVWEVSKDLQTWTPVIAGTNDATDYNIYDADGNFVAGLNCSMDVIGSGEDLKLLLYSTNNKGIAFNQSGYRLDEYALGTATTWTGTPKNILEGGKLGLVHTNVEFIYDGEGGYWFGASRAGNAGQPNLVHINAAGEQDYYNEDASLYGGDGVLVHNGMLFKGKARTSGTVGNFGVWTIGKDADGKVTLTEKWSVVANGIGRNLNEFAVDYAENLYVVGNSGEKIIAYALPYSGTVVTPAASQYAFQVAGSTPEIEWIEMPLEITNLTTSEIPVGDVTYLQLMGRDDMNDADVMLFLNNYTGEEKAYEVNSESSLMTFGGLELTVMDGSLTKSIDPEKGDVFAGTVHASVEEEGETMYVEFALTMYAMPAIEIAIEDVEITIDEESAIAIFAADWEGTPLQVEVSGFENAEFMEYEECWLSIGDDNVWVDAAVGPVAVIIEDGLAMLEGEFTSYATGKSYYVTLTGNMPGAVEPVEMVGVVKRALQYYDATIVLTHEADGTAHIYNVVDGVVAEVSQEGVIAVDPENAGDYLAISDIALTEDGKLIATNYMQTQAGDDYVDAGYKRGETRIYMWDDLAGAPSILFTSKMCSNWFRSKQGLTMAVKGTSDNMEIFMTGIHATKAWARVSSYRVIDGVYVEPDVNNNDYYHFYDVADAVALETIVGTQYELTASPLGAMNWILDAEKINPIEIVEPETNNVEISSCVALSTDLGKKFNGTSIVTVGEQVLMVAPYATAEGLLAGVKVLDITAGLDAATEVATADLDAAVEATAAATAVAVAENVLTITLVADATIYTLNVELESGPDYMVIEDNITNLVIDLENMAIIGGPSTMWQVEVFLGLAEDDNMDGQWSLSPESSVAIMGFDARLIDGYVYDIDVNAPAAKAVLHVEDSGFFYEIKLDMTSTPTEAIVVVVEDATVTIDTIPLFGDAVDYALKMTADWTYAEDGVTYPVLVEVPVYYPEATEPSEMTCTVTIGGWGDNDPWLGFGEGTLTITTVDGVVTAKGIVANPYTGVAFDVTVSGKLPQGPGTGLDNVQVEVKVLKTIKNGQLIIVRDGKEFNAQGAVVK